MPLINDKEVVDRNNRPSVTSRVLLKTFFINDGEYQDPLYVSSCHVFARSENITPHSVIGEDGLVSPSSTYKAEMVFAPSGDARVQSTVNQGQFKPENYSQQVVGAPGATYIDMDPASDTYQQEITNDLWGWRCFGVSSIYHLGPGEFACVLDGVLAGALSGIDGNGEAIANTADLAIRYFDIWTVQTGDATKWKTFTNEFILYDDTFISLTEPALLRTKNTLFNRKVTLGSKTDLKIGTQITVENQNIDQSIKNIFKESAITSAIVEVQKINEDPNLPGRHTIVSSTDALITGDNTIVYTLDIDKAIKNGQFGTATDIPDPENECSYNADGVGSRSGTYAVRVSYTLLHEKIVSDFMYFIVQ